MMEKNYPVLFGEIIFGSSKSAVSKQISKLESLGKIRKIAPRVYTSNFEDSEEEIIKRNLFLILGKLYPGALLSHRSALELQPTASGNVFLTYTYTKRIRVPGLVLRFIQGAEPIEGDRPLSGYLYVSQLERALLENLQVTRQSGDESKILSEDKIEARLERIYMVKGQQGLKLVQERSLEISTQLGMEREYAKLNQMIEKKLASPPSKILSSQAAVIKNFGSPYDTSRLVLLERLLVALKQNEFAEYPDEHNNPEVFRDLSFFDVYFSNSLDGNHFDLYEARSVVESEIPIPSRFEESYDLLSGFSLMSSLEEMELVPERAEEFLDAMLYRHSVMFGARINQDPGVFRSVNLKGEIAADHRMIRGTLTKGFEYSRALEDPLARAIYLMFLILNIKPFLYGNGRIARLMMNAELVKGRRTRILIPLNNAAKYHEVFERASKFQDFNTLILFMLELQKNSAVHGDSFEDLQNLLESVGAFERA